MANTVNKYLRGSNSKGSKSKQGVIVWNGVKYKIHDVAHVKGVHIKSVTYAMDLYPDLIDEFMRLTYKDFLRNRRQKPVQVRHEKTEPVSCWLCWWFAFSGSDRFSNVIR